MNYQALNASQILAIKMPGAIFPDNLADAEHVRIDLLKLWHPDRNKDPEAGHVVNHIITLHKQVVEQIEQGKWEAPGVKFVIDTNGKKHRIVYKKHRPFELGDVYYGRNKLIYIVRSEFADLFTSGMRTCRNLKYENEDMRKEVSRYLPTGLKELALADGSMLAVMDKTPDVFMLADLVQHLGGKVPPKHLAWMISAIFNLACYFQITGMTHNAITPETIFISPQHHSCLLLGGWWYAVPEGRRLQALPSFTSQICPPYLLAKKEATSELDRMAIHALGRTLLGDPTGTLLQATPELPQPFINFFRHPPLDTAVKDYEHWQKKVLPDSFGPRRFTELAVPESAIYGD